MHTVHYTKHFLSGNLKGLEVNCQVSYPDAESALGMLDYLDRCTPDHPGSDCCTGAQYFVSYDGVRLTD
jgi:hypothetical protein